MPRSEISVKSSRFLVLASIAVVVAGLYFAQDILVPIALAILLSFLLAPSVRRLEHLKLPRVLAVLLTAALAFGFLGGIGYVVYNQTSDLSAHLDTYRKNIDRKLESLRSSNGLLAGVKHASEEVSNILTAPTSQPSMAVPVVVVNNSQGGSETPESPLRLIGDVGAKLLGPAGTTIMVIVFTIFMLFQREDLRDRFIRLVGSGQLTVTTQALDDAADRVSRYLQMQSIINGSVGVAVMAALWAIGKLNGSSFPNPVLWGLLAAILRFIPYVGIWLAAPMPLALSLAAFPSANVAIEALGAYLAIELLAANVAEPLMYGASTGLATLAILIAAAFWTWLWGIMGLLLATPLTVCLVVIGKYVPQLEFLSVLLGDEPALPPPARVYQRLLALDAEEADALIYTYAAKMPLEELYDTILLPVLAMTQRDRQHDNIDQDRYAFVCDSLSEITDELIEKETQSDPQPPQPPRPMIPSGIQINVVCIPAHATADEVAASMFAQLLRLRNYHVEVLSTEQLAGEMVVSVMSLDPDVLCISALPPRP